MGPGAWEKTLGIDEPVKELCCCTVGSGCTSRVALKMPLRPLQRYYLLEYLEEDRHKEAKSTCAGVKG